MRLTFAASLLLSPMLVTASAVASQPTTDAPVKTQVRSVTTGVTAPEFLGLTSLHVPTESADNNVPAKGEVVLRVKVDAYGLPHDVTILKSTNHQLDASVSAAVSSSHFRPAKLGNWNVPEVVNLVVDVNPAQ